MLHNIPPPDVLKSLGRRMPRRKRQYGQLKRLGKDKFWARWYVYDKDNRRHPRTRTFSGFTRKFDAQKYLENELIAGTLAEIKLQTPNDAVVQEALALVPPGSVGTAKGQRVYFVTSPDGYVKIGLGRRVKSRFSQLQSANPVELSLAIAVKGDEEKERSFHRIFRDDWIRGEWFTLSGTIQRFIDLAWEVPKAAGAPE